MKSYLNFHQKTSPLTDCIFTTTLSIIGLYCICTTAKTATQHFHTVNRLSKQHLSIQQYCCIIYALQQKPATQHINTVSSEHQLETDLRHIQQSSSAVGQTSWKIVTDQQFKVPMRRNRTLAGILCIHRLNQTFNCDLT